MNNYRKILRDLVIETIQEDTEYQKLVTQVMNIIGIDSPTDLSDEKKAEFFSYLDSIWDKEKGERRKEPDTEEIKAIFGESVNESRRYTSKTDALNDFFMGKISAEELSDLATNHFRSPIATKKQLQDFLKNKFLQDMMADTYNLSTSELVKKVKELVDKKLYESTTLNEKIQDLGKGDTVHVSKENKTGMVLKQYGRKVHVKFPDGKEKTYNHDEVRKIEDENINESEIPIEKVKVGDTVTNPTGGNKRTNPPIFTVDKIEKRKGSRGQEIVLHGKDRFGKKQALIRDKGKPVRLEESIVTETHWINPQAQQKLAYQFKTKKNKLKFTDFPKGDKTPSSKIISGKVTTPDGETYKVDVNWKTGEIDGYVKESVTESSSPLAQRIFDRNKWGKAIHDKVLKGRAWDRQKVDKFLDDLEDKDPKKWEAAIRSLSHDSLIGNRFKTYGHQITVLLDELAELYKDYTG